MAEFPIEAVRGRFPALSLTDEGRRRIYLDNPAGTQVPRAVADAVSRCLLSTNANLGGFFETTVAAQYVVNAAHAMGDGGGHIQSLVVGSVFLIWGVLVLLIGLVADLIAHNRQLIEMTLLRVRNLELERAQSAHTRQIEIEQTADTSNGDC